MADSQSRDSSASLVTGWGDNVATWVPQTTYHAVVLGQRQSHRALCGVRCSHVDADRPWTGHGDENGLACQKCLAVSRRSGTGQVSDPTVQAPDYVARVNDVAQRFDRLPIEIVLRALRAELGGFESDDAALTDLARRISGGEFAPEA